MTLDIDEQLANFRDARALVVESLDDIDTKIAALLNAKKLLSANVKVAVTIRIAGISKAKNDNSAAATIQNFAVKAYAKHWEKTGSNHFRRLYPADEAPSPQSTVPDRLGVERPSEHSLAAD